jgi:hypothetical protein
MSIRIQREIEALRNDEGLVRAETVVIWARGNPDSELHLHFEWDDAVAGEKYRIDQARQLIRIHVLTDEGDRKLVSLSIDRPSGGGYRDLTDVLPSASMREIMLRDAIRELQRVRTKYARLNELADVYRAIDAAAATSPTAIAA